MTTYHSGDRVLVRAADGTDHPGAVRVALPIGLCVIELDDPPARGWRVIGVTVGCLRRCPSKGFEGHQTA